jgi:hypothetical protein
MGSGFKESFAVAQNQTAHRTHGIQQSLFALTPAGPRLGSLETKGVVYTKQWVVEFLLDLAGFQSGNDLVRAVAVEPAAGEGAFLGPMIERLMDSCNRRSRPLSDCINSLVAYELNERSAADARSLAIQVLTNRGATRSLAEKLANAWVRTGDYLLDSLSIEADFVIGNPPYVRLEDIPEETAGTYRRTYRTMSGRADLYVAFFEAALRQLREGGVCAFICADRWMRNQYGGVLRELVTSGFSVDTVVEMHNADAFQDEVDAYPAITVIRRARPGPTVVAAAGPGVERATSRELSAALLATANGQSPALPPGLRTARVEKWFKGANPWPCHSPEQLALLRKLEERFPALEAGAKVGIGVATGNDKLFVTKDPQLVEPSQLLKLAVADDIGSGTMKWSGNYLVDPWNDSGLVDLKKYSRLKAYLESHADVLKERHTAIHNTKGWYRTIDRVTHSLTSKWKLYIADIKNVLAPVLDRGETYPHHNLYFIQSDEWDLEVLGGLLLSAVGQFFVSSYGVRMRGGYFRFQAQYLRRIRVPLPTDIPAPLADALKRAFRTRDRAAATEAALSLYGIGAAELENAIEY